MHYENTLIVFLALLFTNVAFATSVYPWATDGDFVGLSPKGLGRFTDLVYFSVASFSTAGYGDIYPKSQRARIMVSFFLLIIQVTIVYGIYQAIAKI